MYCLYKADKVETGACILNLKRVLIYDNTIVALIL